MTEPAEALNGLRPVHLPADFGEAGLLAAMALAGCISALAVMAWLRLRPLRLRPVRRAAVAALSRSRALPPPERLAAQAALLRRIVGATEGEAAARLRDGEWLACLDRRFATAFFTAGAGRAYGASLYRPASGVDVAALDEALQRLIARLKR